MLIAAGFKGVKREEAIELLGNGTVHGLRTKEKVFTVAYDGVYATSEYYLFVIRMDRSFVREMFKLDEEQLERLFGMPEFILPCQWEKDMDKCLYYTSKTCSNYPRYCTYNCQFAEPNIDWVAAKAATGAKLSRVEHNLLFGK